MYGCRTNYGGTSIGRATYGYYCWIRRKSEWLPSSRWDWICSGYCHHTEIIPTYKESNSGCCKVRETSTAIRFYPRHLYICINFSSSIGITRHFSDIENLFIFVSYEELALFVNATYCQMFQGIGGSVFCQRIWKGFLKSCGPFLRQKNIM